MLKLTSRSLVCSLLLGALTLPVHAQPGSEEGLPAGPAPKPNIVFIMMDDLGWADLAPYGNTYIQTPNLQELADEGVKLSSYYSGASVCSPTRYSLMSGRFPIEQAYSGTEHGAVQGVDTGTLPGGNPTYAYVLEDTLPRLLAEKDYRTYHVGKWHIAGWNRPETYPKGPQGGVGFDRSARMEFTAATGGGTSHVDPIVHLDEGIGKRRSGLSSDVAVDQALAFLEEHQNQYPAQPFFLNLWLYAPHRPLDGGSEQWKLNYFATGSCPFAGCPEETMEERLYAAMVSYADEQIGLLLDALDAYGLANDTLVIVTSDNGGDTGDGIHPHGNGDLRGGKLRQYEGGIRVPFIARWHNGGVVGGLTNDSVVTSLDMLPTLAKLAGFDLETPRFDEIRGLDRIDALTSETRVDRDQYMMWTGLLNTNQVAPSFGWEHPFAVRKGFFKLVLDSDPSHSPARPSVELFDLFSDPGETIDVRSDNPAVAQDFWNQYWQQRQAVTKIDYEIESTVGTVQAVGDDLIFDAGGLKLAYRSSFDYSARNEFSVAFDFTATELPPAGSPRTLVDKYSAWSVFLDGDQLFLELHGKAIGDFPDDTVQPLLSGIQPGTSYRVGVSFLKQKFKSQMEVRWTVNGTTSPANIFNLFEHLNNRVWAYDSIYVGMRSDQSERFTGTISNLRLHTLALTPEELNDGTPAMP